MSLKSKEPRLRDWNASRKTHDFIDKRTWNQKNLDYEIETSCLCRIRCLTQNLKSKEPRLRDWNIQSFLSVYSDPSAWNQKNLDYEIETWRCCTRDAFTPNFIVLEIKRTSITRLKRSPFCCATCFLREVRLKSKEPRLRDWSDRQMICYWRCSPHIAIVTIFDIFAWFFSEICYHFNPLIVWQSEGNTWQIIKNWRISFGP